jgi:hypothetical protein
MCGCDLLPLQVVKTNMRTLMLVHGILMAVSFVLLMPTGILLARHRYVMNMLQEASRVTALADAVEASIIIRMCDRTAPQAA